MNEGLSPQSSRQKKLEAAHNIAGLIAVVLTGALLFWSFFFSDTFPLFKMVPFGKRIESDWFGSSLIVCLFFCYLFTRYFLQASRHFQIMVAALLVIAVVLYLVLQSQKTRIDWTAYGLNPNLRGFKPQVVILSGTTEDGFFEIRMRGADYYYRKTWNQMDWGMGARFDLELDTPEFSMTWGLHRSGAGTGGGGGFSPAPNDGLVLARRLWNGINFVGADTNRLSFEENPSGMREDFANLKKVGPWLIPMQIKFRGLHSGVYTVRKVEFWTEPDTNWYFQVKRKYLDHDPSAATNDLHEPGLVRGRK
jgi:hypothetical protein